MFYHASSVGGIVTLEPRVSNHHIPLIYFSTKRENVLVYLSNSIQKFCTENSFKHDGVWYKWASYGFDKDGVQRIEEYYPNALIETYKGVSGYIYSAKEIVDYGFPLQIPNAVASKTPVSVTGCEVISDAYKAILYAEEQGLVRVTRYSEMSEKTRAWLEKTVPDEYKTSADHPDYRFFLKAKFNAFL